MRVLLDTDTMSMILKAPPLSPLLSRLVTVPVDSRFISTISVAELWYGFARTGGRHESLRRTLEDVWLPRIGVLPFDLPAARVYATLRADLERRGEPLAEPDLRIAAVALANNLTLITGNERHFARVPGLRVENWLA